MSPFSSFKPCSRCGQRVKRGERYCAACRKVSDATDRSTRGSSTARGYNAKWRAYRLVFLQRHPLCVECARKGRIQAATVVDHIVAPKGNVQMFWDKSNHRAVCKPCHDARVEEGDFGVTQR
jgi:5-methylcytosine-specific restriction enzyme A